MKTLHWYIPWATVLHSYNMTGRGGKLQQLHCYHTFSDSLDIYLTKNHYENYSPKMVPIAKLWGPGSWTKTSVKFKSKFKHFHSRKCVWKCRLRNAGHFVSAPMCIKAWTFVWLPQCQCSNRQLQGYLATTKHSRPCACFSGCTERTRQQCAFISVFWLYCLA